MSRASNADERRIEAAIARHGSAEAAVAALPDVEPEKVFKVWRRIERLNADESEERPAGPGLKPCGTQAAYVRHIRNGEPTDEACRVAHAAAVAEDRRLVTAGKLQPCGTRAAYRRHRKRGEKPCAACCEGNRESYRATRKRRVLKPCGTYPAYVRHRRRREVPCQPCKDANNVYKHGKRASA